MFDFDRIIEKVTGLLGDGGALQDVVSGDLTETLSNAGIDPSLLDNLPMDQVQQFLADSGVDVSSLTEGQAADLIQEFTEWRNG